MPLQGTIGEIMLVPYASLIPEDWLPCEGQKVPIKGNEALFSLLGNTFGGDLATFFCLPDLRGRTAVDASRFPGLQPGFTGGQEQVALDATHIPEHLHFAYGTTAEANARQIVGAIYANTAAAPPAVPQAPPLYGPAVELVAIDPETVQPGGSGLPHNNLQPTLALRYLICIKGLFPSHP
jgi:microcystin-dependent protein